jgi:hypothetical protein
MTISREERYTKQGASACGFSPTEGDTIASEEEGEEGEATPPDGSCAPNLVGTVYAVKKVVKSGNYYGNHITTFTYSKGEDGTGCELTEELNNEGYCAVTTTDPDEPAPEPDPVTGITPPATVYNKVTTVTNEDGSGGYSFPASDCNEGFSSPGESYSSEYHTVTTTEGYSCGDAPDTSTSTGSSSYTKIITFCNGGSFTESCSSTMSNGVWSGALGGGSCVDSFGETVIVKTYADPVPYITGSTTLSGPRQAFGIGDWEEWEEIEDDEGPSTVILAQNKITYSGGYQVKGKYGHWVERCNIGEEYTTLMIKTTGPSSSSTCFSLHEFEPECMDYVYETQTFTATKPVEFFDCSLNAGVSESDFINNNYSLSPETYGLPSSEVVVGSPSEEVALPEEMYCLKLEVVRDVNVDRTFLL